MPRSCRRALRVKLAIMARNEHNSASDAVVAAVTADIPAWRILAAEVESLFGPMVGDPTFEQALARGIERGTAFCIRAGNRPGTPLLGALLFSPTHAPLYRIGWLAVTAGARRMGIGRRLVRHALALVKPPAIVEVVTFTIEQIGGAAARDFYASLGFAPAEIRPFGPEAAPRQLFRLNVT